MTSRFPSRDDSPAVPRPAAQLARWNRRLRRAGVGFATLILAAATAFALIDVEPVFQRAASVIILGIIPASLTWLGTALICRMLTEASLLFDSTATVVRRILS
jgi:hypothetical protein